MHPMTVNLLRHSRISLKELYYIAPDRSLEAVPVETGVAFKAGTPADLFAI